MIAGLELGTLCTKKLCDLVPIPTIFRCLNKKGGGGVGEREEKTFLFAKNNADFSVYCDRRLFLLSLILLCFGQLTLVSIIENLDSQTFVPPKGK